MPATSESGCCKMETGALIYGIISLVLLGVSALAGLGLMFYSIFSEIPSSHDLVIYIIIIIICVSPAVVIMPFSIILIYGVCKKKPGLVLTYLIFRAVLILLVVAGSIFLLVAGPIALGIILLVTYLVCSLPLIVVFLAYKKLKSGRIYDQCNKT